MTGKANQSRQKGRCPVCGRFMALTWTGNGALMVHGPKDARCPGSGQQPAPGGKRPEGTLSADAVDAAREETR